MMEIDEAYLVGINRNCFRAGIPTKVIGVKFIKPDGLDIIRECYHIEWYDGLEDWIPLMDTKNYKLISFRNILEGKIPKVEY